MPPLPVPGSPTTPPPGGGSAPGQPPFGATPLTMPTPNRGNEAAATALVRNAMDMLSKALASLGPAGAASEVGKAVLDALKPLSKIQALAPGATTPGAQQASMQQFMMEQRQAAPLLAQLAAMRGGPGGGIAPPGGGGPPGPSPALGGAG